MSEGQTEYYGHGLKGMGDDWGDWKQWAQCSYHGQPHHSDQPPPDMKLYDGSYLRWWNGAEEKFQQLIRKNGWFRHMPGARQTRHLHLHTHSLHKQKTTQMGKTVWDTICQSNWSILAISITTLTESKIHLIKIGSVQFCSNRISHWLKLSSWLTVQCDTCDCCSFTLTGVCAHSHTLTHRHTQVIFC